MAISIGIINIVAVLVVFANSKPLGPKAVLEVSNSRTSLSLLYQNNLNASDDKNHVGALLLGPLPQSDASAACAALSEKPISKSTLQKYKSDFARVLAY